MTIWVVAILSLIVAIYACGGRKWLKAQPWAAGFYQLPVIAWIERVFFKNSESILWGRFLQALGYTLSAIASLGGIDLTPLALVLPQGWSWVVSILPLVIALAGHIQVQLRLDTTKPIELVALPPNVPADVAVAAMKVEAANEQAVAIVQEAKQSGAV